MIPVTTASTTSPLFQWVVVLTTILNYFSWRAHDHLCTKSKNCILDYKSPYFFKTFFSCFYSCTFFLIWGTAEVSVFGHVLTAPYCLHSCRGLPPYRLLSCLSEGFPGGAAAAKSLQSCPTLCNPIDRQPTRLPCLWDSPGKNTGVGCHFLLQCVKVKSLSRVWLFMTQWTAAYQAPPPMGFSRQEYWSGLPLPSIYDPANVDN